MYDLLIRAQCIVCPATRLETAGAMAINDDRIVAVGPDVDGPAKQTLEFSDGIVLPGLVDLHAHPACEGSKFGVDPDVEFLLRGVTTVMSQGDAGANNIEQYIQTTIERSKTCVKLAIHLSSEGESMAGGSFENMDWVDVDACVRAIEAHREHIWGIATNVSVLACGTSDPREVMRRAVEAAERTGLPILYGIRNPKEWSWQEQMALLRPGDVMTYLYRPGDWSIVDTHGKVHPAVYEARERGVLFDVGHGMASFDFHVAEAALADGFAPDTISTDQYKRHVGCTPQHDLPRTMSKLLAAGMSESEIFRAVTLRPAEILGLENEVGTLSIGSRADVTVLRFSEEAEPLVDAQGNQRPGGCWEAECVIKNGELVRGQE